MIGSGLNLLCLQSNSKPERRWTWPQGSRFVVLTKRSVASGDENEQKGKRVGKKNKRRVPCDQKSSSETP